ncbi:hypothetical protein HK104_005768 [Borealophlyctis nickersoniae]|nr:hypothetical protein HK104_005768 [Borealophlyctis nickersoniae]
MRRFPEHPGPTNVGFSIAGAGSRRRQPSPQSPPSYDRGAAANRSRERDRGLDREQRGGGWDGRESRDTEGDSGRFVSGNQGEPRRRIVEPQSASNRIVTIGPSSSTLSSGGAGKIKQQRQPSPVPQTRQAQAQSQVQEGSSTTSARPSILDRLGAKVEEPSKKRRERGRKCSSGGAGGVGGAGGAAGSLSSALNAASNDGAGGLAGGEGFTESSSTSRHQLDRIGGSSGLERQKELDDDVGLSQRRAGAGAVGRGGGDRGNDGEGGERQELLDRDFSRARDTSDRVESEYRSEFNRSGERRWSTEDSGTSRRQQSPHEHVARRQASPSSRSFAAPASSISNRSDANEDYDMEEAISLSGYELDDDDEERDYHFRRSNAIRDDGDGPRKSDEDNYRDWDGGKERERRGRDAQRGKEKDLGDAPRDRSDRRPDHWSPGRDRVTSTVDAGDMFAAAAEKAAKMKLEQKEKEKDWMGGGGSDSRRMDTPESRKKKELSGKEKEGSRGVAVETSKPTLDLDSPRGRQRDSAPIRGQDSGVRLDKAKTGEKPKKREGSPEQLPEPPKPWTICHSKTTGKSYYFNEETQESSWDLPKSRTEEKRRPNDGDETEAKRRRTQSDGMLATAPPEHRSGDRIPREAGLDRTRKQGMGEEESRGRVAESRRDSPKRRNASRTPSPHRQAGPRDTGRANSPSDPFRHPWPPYSAPGGRANSPPSGERDQYWRDWERDREYPSKGGRLPPSMEGRPGAPGARGPYGPAPPVARDAWGMPPPHWGMHPMHRPPLPFGRPPMPLGPYPPMGRPPHARFPFGPGMAGPRPTPPPVEVRRGPDLWPPPPGMEEKAGESRASDRFGGPREGRDQRTGGSPPSSRRSESHEARRNGQLRPGSPGGRRRHNDDEGYDPRLAAVNPRQLLPPEDRGPRRSPPPAGGDDMRQVSRADSWSKVRENDRGSVVTGGGNGGTEARVLSSRMEWEQRKALVGGFVSKGDISANAGWDSNAPNTSKRPPPEDAVADAVRYCDANKRRRPSEMERDGHGR